MYVSERFKLNKYTVEKIKAMVPDFGYGLFSEYLFYNHYSRPLPSGYMESWADCVLRVTEGTLSIRKNHYIKNYLPWDESFWQHYAVGFATSMFNMHWLPPGRGLWAMGTEFIYERGAMALYNCAYTRITDNIGDDIHWLMDCSMNGVGVGFYPERNDQLEVYRPMTGNAQYFIIPDSREGWCDSAQLLIESYMSKGMAEVVFDYSQIRPAGSPIKGFGGIASGPGPLKDFHERVRRYFEMYILDPDYDSVALKTDIANAAGVCVVSGNVRRSAEIACGHIDDQTFLDLKDYKKNPYRVDIGWMSNNSVLLDTPDDFDYLGEIAARVKKNGEPGYINRMNFKYGRIGKDEYAKMDYAEGINPCGEIPLENREVCNVSETLPTRCQTPEDWYEACRHAALYCQTVSLLPTHQPTTNQVVARNRRTGVSIVDYTGWKHEQGLHKVISYLRKGYDVVCNTNRWAAGEAGVPASIRNTTFKPGGTVPKLAGRTSGIGFPTFKHTIRRVRVSKLKPIYELLIKAGIPHEPELFSPETTEVFEFPIIQGPAKPAEEVSLWEQAANVVTAQREWADNAVSNTLYFRPKWVLVSTSDDPSTFESTLNQYGLKLEDIDFEISGPFVKAEVLRDDKHIPLKLNIYRFNIKHEEDDIESVLSSIAPLTKSISLLPHTGKGVYAQMPEEGITEEEYKKRIKQITTIDWSQLRNNNPEAELFCEGDKCQLPV